LKKLILTLLLMTFLTAPGVTGEELTPERQEEIVKNFMFVTGQGDRGRVTSLRQEVSAGLEVPLKCGTPAVCDFVQNYHRLDKNLLLEFGAAPESLVTRPALSDSIVSASGKFMIHYTTTGEDAAYQSNITVGGVPVYILSVADIFDSVYNNIVNVLGYPPPPTDGFYPQGSGDEFDVYVSNLGGAVYGLTWMDSVFIDGPASTRATAFMEIDNDYQEISIYRNRPLAAVRVTAAHEYFHVVQFGIDFTEAEEGRRYWMEMSATWMEEELYDGINDYYYYLPAFFRDPHASIQQFLSAVDLHPYGAAVFPIYLREKFGPEIIREIWLRCGENTGPDFLQVSQDVIDSVTSGALDFATIFSEFVRWNYFTGSRAGIASAGAGYSERANYPAIPDSVMAIRQEYPVFVPAPRNPLNPHHNAAIYLRFEEVGTISDDTSYWRCNDGAYPACNDSTRVVDTSLGYDFFHIDSFMNAGVGLDPTFKQPWGVNVIYQLENQLDSFEVENFLLPGELVHYLNIPNPRDYRTIAMIFSPASHIWQNYNQYSPIDLAYFVFDKGSVDSAYIDRPASVLTPYPNPAVLSEMDTDSVYFRFQVPTNGTSYPVLTGTYLVVDIFSVVGEYLATISTDQPNIFQGNSAHGEVVFGWDLKNKEGRHVASGVYIAYARLFSAKKDGQLLAEDKVKVAVIR